MNGIDEQKKALRKHFLSARAALGAMEHMVLDGVINTRIAALEEFTRADVVMAYASDGCEVNVRSVAELAMRQGKAVAFPRYNQLHKCYEPVLITKFDQDMVIGKYNLPEPRMDLPLAEFTENSLWLVPAVAFDQCGCRLGRGGGFYDRMLKMYPGKRVGVFYQCQYSCDALPSAEHDQRLTMAVTENNVYKF